MRSLFRDQKRHCRRRVLADLVDELEVQPDGSLVPTGRIDWHAARPTCQPRLVGARVVASGPWRVAAGLDRGDARPVSPWLPILALLVFLCAIVLAVQVVRQRPVHTVRWHKPIDIHIPLGRPAP